MATITNIEAIVMGGSAGALPALETILQAVPRDCRIPLVVVLHILPGRPSLLAGVLGGRCALPVKEVEDKEPVQPGTVYVAPPGYHLLIERDRAFALSVDDLVFYSRPSIDVLFESAAEAYGARLAGVVLSGANEDGAAGLAAIKARGGLCIVQSPADAQSSTMPQSALAAVRADHVLPGAGLASLVSNLAAVATAAAIAAAKRGKELR